LGQKEALFGFVCADQAEAHHRAAILQTVLNTFLILYESQNRISMIFLSTLKISPLFPPSGEGRKEGMTKCDLVKVLMRVSYRDLFSSAACPNLCLNFS
jgi:hypothetical protein